MDKMFKILNSDTYLDLKKNKEEVEVVMLQRWTVVKFSQCRPRPTANPTTGLVTNTLSQKKQDT